MPSVSLLTLGGICSATFAISSAVTASKAAPHRHIWVQTKRGIPNKSPNTQSETDCPCEVCSGVGRTNCWNCFGRGRVNYTDAAMLPKGVDPVWCSTCRGGGLVYCSRCMGSGVKREPIGFRV
mmetsp:Transcript_37512/g.105930  ORF Transcript_37512/g.105930 Transcript_37512/m.105930 type:complete len:123 (+) Transcript_37512:100-468(+)